LGCFRQVTGSKEDESVFDLLGQANGGNLIVMTIEKEILAAALSGLESQHARIVEQIGTVRSLMRGSKASAGTTEPGSSAETGGRKRRKRRKLSAEARERMAAAQRRRWAKVRKQS
jgi:hypothetical protein